jgi:hypothetical protein
MPKDRDRRADLHRKLDVIIDGACSELATTVTFVIDSSYKIVRRKRRKATNPKK